MNAPTHPIPDLSHLSFEQIISTRFTLPTPVIDRLECYFLRKWQISYFLDQMDWQVMSLVYDDVEYRIVFLDNLNWHEHWTQVMLSFRKPVNKTIPAYVLVKGY